MQTALERHLPYFEGILRFELRPYQKTLLEIKEHMPLVLIIDELDGTTNTKRCLASCLDFAPLATISLALSLSESLEGLVIGAVYALDQREVFSAIRVEQDQFLAFHNRCRMLPTEFTHTRGDSQRRIMVIGYSNSHRREKGELEQLLYDAGFRIYEGCRASSVDILNMLRNAFDAYVDLRRFWSTKVGGEEKEAMLQVYDVAGVVPVAEGCGLVVTDAEGRPWKKYSFDETISLVVARPDIHAKIINIIAPLVADWQERLTANA